MKVHPAAELFPMMTEAELSELAVDIQQNGQRHPLVIFSGLLLDGRNRMAACGIAGVKPRTEVLAQCDSPTAYVISANLHRRHLLPAQRAACAADPKVLDLFKAEAKARQRAGQKSGGRGKKKLAGHSNREVSTGEATEQAAKAFKAGTSATKALSHIATAAPEVFAAVKNGTVATVADAKRLAQLAEEPRAAAMRAIADGAAPPDAIRDTKRASIRSSLESVSARDAKSAAGVYDVVVLDPPWPMQKIERDVRPNQSEFDYPTMSEADLAELSVPCADDCHVWVWTTHKFLPMALRLLDRWDLNYVCAFVWHKPGGFQPIGLPQYNCEFALYARRGSPEFLDTKAFPTCFEAPRGAHSEKPEEFYDVVRRVTAGRRLDMFNRRLIDGFDGWGKEAADAAE